ncbi:MAG: hypothetical protein ABIP28_11490 [Mucilaginibacter sp.]
MPHKAFALHPDSYRGRQNLGWDKFAPLIASREAIPSAKNPYAPPPHHPQSSR